MATGYSGYAGYGAIPSPQQSQSLLANSLLNEGLDSSPIRSGWQGAARLAQTLVGAMLGNQQLASQKAAIDQGNALLTGLTGGAGAGGATPGADALPPPPASGGAGALANPPPASGASANAYPGYDPAAVKAMAPQIFAANGVDPAIGMKVLASEGLNSYVGDNRSSFGPGQLHYGGVAGGGNAIPGLGDEFTRQTGLDARDSSTVPQQLQFIAQQAAKNGWGPWHGAANSGIGNWDGISRAGAAPQAVAGAGPNSGAAVQYGAAAGQSSMGADAQAQPGLPIPQSALGGLPPVNRINWNGQGMPPPPPQGQSAAAGAPPAAASPGALAFAGPQGVNPAQAAIAANAAPPGGAQAPPSQLVAGGPGAPGLPAQPPGARPIPPQGAPPMAGQPGAVAPPQPAPGMPPGVPPMQGTPQANPAIIRQAYAVMSNPYADPAIKEMAANILQQQISLSMPQPYTWKDIPGTNNQQAFDRYGRPVQGMVIQGGPQKLGPGDTLYNTGMPGAPGAQGGSPGVSMVPGTGGTDYYAKKAAAEETAKLQAQQATPSAQTYQEFQGKLKEGQGYKEYSMALPTWNSMLVHAQQNSPPADKAMVDDMAKILNPGRAVGMGQFAVNSDIQSVPEELRGYAAKMLSGDASIRAQARAQMLAAAQAKVTEYKSSWDTDANQNKRIAQKFGYDPDLAIPQLPDMAPYDAAKGLPGAGVAVPGVGGPAPGGIQLMPGAGGPPTASAATPGAQPQGADMLGAARAAIAKGAPRAAVEQRLRTLGINPAGL